jgi:hypothetical protein
MTTDLIARIENAAEGSRELDAEIYNAVPEEGRVAVKLPIGRWGDRWDDGWRTKRAVYSEDRPIEFWRSLHNFTEASEDEQHGK